MPATSTLAEQIDSSMHNHSTRRAGFTIIEIMIVVSVIGIISAIAIPQLRAAKLTANESSAASTLRAITAAQAQVIVAPTIDTDSDGAGEHGYFAELAGSMPCRVGIAGAPAAGQVGIDELTPSALLSSLGQVQNGVVIHSGYIFQLWLPGARIGGAVPAIAEDVDGGKIAAPFPDPDGSESMWCAYAWPLRRGRTGFPAFFVNQQGQLLICSNRGGVQYDGVGAGPAFDAALTIPGDMSSNFPPSGIVGNDGNLWNVFR